MTNEAQSQTEAGPAPTARVLVVDDEQMVRQAVGRTLRRAGYEVILASDGLEASEILEREPIDLVLSDITMPGRDGVDLLRSIREHHQELPVILFTGNPTTESAIGAVNLRATGYLRKPVKPETVLQEVTQALKMKALAEVRQEAHELILSGRPSADPNAQLSADFDQALDSVFMVYQPIVDWRRRTVFGHEALVRAKSEALPHPGALFDAAERLDRLQDLGRRIRGLAPLPMDEAPQDVSLFLNLHPSDLLDESLYAPDSAIARMAPRLVLEITERARLQNIDDAAERIDRLRQLGFRIAIDDIGAGYSGLNSFAMLHPDLIKLDMDLVRDIDHDAVKQRLVRLLLQMSEDLGISVVAEGVETAGERDMLLRLGCELLQGYFFGRPGAPFVEPTW
ncbi:MAG: EAL domain-containing response regulator [Myxococcales bacterium]